MFSRLSEVGRLSAFLPDGRPDGRLVQLLTESDGVVSLVYDEGRGPLAIGFGLVYPRLEMASAKLDVGFAAMPIGWRKVLAVARAMLTRTCAAVEGVIMKETGREPLAIDCYATVPLPNRPARLLAHAIGMRLVARIPRFAVWEGDVVDAVIYHLAWR